MESVTKEVVTSPDVWKSAAPFSQAIRAGNTMYVSGQLGMDPNTGKLVPGGIAAETRQALTNLSKILEAGRMSLKCVAKCTVYLGDMKDFQDMNKVYSEFFTENQPARAAFQVAKLPLGGLVEIEAIAVDTEKTTNSTRFRANL
ncbi:2-iminobutanoate/2-iminopropanoate deaminase-like isoform X3 [Haemaphysalis longicornis]